jgi:DNA-directed RNA polymerase specialized sigma24 family protein
VADEYLTERDELGAIADRDEGAFSGWLARSEIRLRLSLRSFAGIVDVESIVQETAILVWERAPALVPDGRPAFLLRWAVTVARNKARNQVVRAGRQAPLAGDLADPAATRLADPMLRDRITRCLSQLSAGFRRAIEARLGDRGQQPDRQLAAAMGMRFDAFRQNLSRARRALTRCLRESGIEVGEYLQ